MLSCKQATHLMSEAQDRKLVIGERLQLRMHLAVPPRVIIYPEGALLCAVPGRS